MPRLLRCDALTMQLAFFLNQSRCSGCFTCVMACRQWHTPDREVMNWRRVDTIEKGIFPNLKVSFLSLSCSHRQTPPCASVCPTSAILKREQDGIVVVDQDICLGDSACGQCREACPYGIPQFHPGRISGWENVTSAMTVLIKANHRSASMLVRCTPSTQGLSISY